MFRIICNIVSIYVSVGMSFYGLVMAVNSWAWSKTHNVSIGEAFKQHFKKQVCISLLMGCVFCWPYTISVVIRSSIETRRRIKNGEFVTIIREIDENRDDLF